jgi:hypothetical protein
VTPASRRPTSPSRRRTTWSSRQRPERRTRRGGIRGVRDPASRTAALSALGAARCALAPPPGRTGRGCHAR